MVTRVARVGVQGELLVVFSWGFGHPVAVYFNAMIIDKRNAGYNRGYNTITSLCKWPLVVESFFRVMRYGDAVGFVWREYQGRRWRMGEG